MHPNRLVTLNNTTPGFKLKEVSSKRLFLVLDCDVNNIFFLISPFHMHEMIAAK